MQGETILCVATRLWDSLWRSTQQTMWRLSQHNRVFFFEPGRNPDLSYRAEIAQNWSYFFNLRARTIHENLTVLATPPPLPYMRKQLPQAAMRVMLPTVAHINARLIARHITWAMQQYDITAPILWLYEPRHVHLAGQFGEKLVCYYNYDEYANFAGNERIKPMLLRYEEQMARQANVIFASSRGQAAYRKQFNPNTYFMPNAVDFDVFNKALDPHTDLAPELAAVKRPIIGFTGWLGYQIDVDLLIRVAQAYPDASLVLVGPDCLPQDARRDQLHALPNVSFFGRKPIDELPRYLKGFDVALIPYVQHGHTSTIYPLKLHEYLAAGQSIVATALPELRPFEHVVRLATTHDDFVAQIGVALHANDEKAIAARVAVARENTWDQRVTDIRRILQQHLAANPTDQVAPPVSISIAP